MFSKLKENLQEMKRIKEIENKSYQEAKAIEDRKAKEKREQPFAVIEITVPHGCKKTAVSMDALDRITREAAFGTDVTIGGKKLGCRAFKVDAVGNLHLVVEPVCFTITERKKEKVGEQLL